MTAAKKPATPLAARPEDPEAPEVVEPDLSGPMYCEHRRTRVNCEDCRAAAAAKAAERYVAP